MILVTGGAGFIGSCIVRGLNEEGVSDIVIVDNLGQGEKWKNLVNLRFRDFIHKSRLLDRLASFPRPEYVIHMGACSSTTERDANYLMENNFCFSKALYDWCVEVGCRFLYASSAATYGDGSQGYDDRLVDELRPLNMYGTTKKLFDQYVLSSPKPKQWVGLRFFNVYGPNEYHKGDMSSVVLKSFEQIRASGKARLFRSHREGCADGEQKRDFIYVRDVVTDVLRVMKGERSGLFNLGTGRARSFRDLVRAVFLALELPEAIEYVDMPPALRDKYQYFTEARMDRAVEAGFGESPRSLEDGVGEYVREFLLKGRRHFEKV